MNFPKPNTPKDPEPCPKQHLTRPGKAFYLQPQTLPFSRLCLAQISLNCLQVESHTAIFSLSFLSLCITFVVGYSSKILLFTCIISVWEQITIDLCIFLLWILCWYPVLENMNSAAVYTSYGEFRNIFLWGIYQRCKITVNTNILPSSLTQYVHQCAVSSAGWESSNCFSLLPPLGIFCLFILSHAGRQCVSHLKKNRLFTEEF